MSNPRSVRSAPQESDPRAIAAVLVLAAVLFILDLEVPLGIAGGVPYVAVILLTMWLSEGAATLVAASGCSVLIVLGYFGSPPGAEPIAALTNRFLAMFAIWSIAILVNRRRSAETMFRLAVMGAPHAILVVDENGRITLTNRKLEEVFGYDRAELVGGAVDVLVPQPLREQHAVLRGDFHRSPSARPMGAGRDLYGRRKDGSRVPVEIGLTPLETNRGRLTLCTIIDITERKRTEAIVAKHSDDLETLLHVISHDLKEPLRAITSFSRMIDSRAGDTLDDKSRDFLRRVVKASERLRSLLDDVLALSRARKLRPESEKSVETRLIVEGAIERLSDRVKMTNATIAVIAPLPVLAVDRIWVEEAVYNLLSNALKFYREGDRPDIEVAAYQSEGRSGETGIVVRDRGPGVAPENTERIFSLFQRAHGREVEGTGAGLAIVRTVAERHGGKAWVQPRHGGGSEFVITFAVAVSEDSQ